jgi:hypothetical protein
MYLGFRLHSLNISPYFLSPSETLFLHHKFVLSLPRIPINNTFTRITYIIETTQKFQISRF